MGVGFALVGVAATGLVGWREPPPTGEEGVAV
jgi:hypothetical protein